MIEEPGQVVAVEQDRIWVQTIRLSACQSCAAQKGCGQKLLNSMSAGRAQQIAVQNHLGARVGDQVVIGIPESALLAASAWVYLVPLLAMIGTAILAQKWLQWPDSGVALAGAIGLALGFVLVRRASVQREESRFQPRLLRFGARQEVVSSETVAVCQPPLRS